MKRETQRSGVISVQSLVWIVLNISLLLLSIAPFVIVPSYSHVQKKNTTEVVDITLKDFFNIDQYNREFSDLKPILRIVMQSIFYILVVETLIAYTVNMIFGGKLILELSRVAKLLPVKRQWNSIEGKRTVQRVLLYKFAIVVGLISSGLALFNRDRVVLLLKLWLVNDLPIDKRTRNELLKMLGLTVYHFVDYVIHSMWIVLFLYTMCLFRKHIQVVRQIITEMDMDEMHLRKLQDRLALLSGHFEHVMSYFALPLSTILVANIIAIIGASCFMLLNQQNKQQYYVSIIFSFGLFSFLRSVLICGAANMATNQYRKLILQVYESVPEWSLEGWMAFIEIRRMKPKFKINFFGMFAVRQATILSMLGFALNYVVVLLQTENYSSS